MIIIEEAIAFTVKAHYGKSRKGKKLPYILHPVEAMTIVASMTDDEEVIAAAVLHDTVEDTNVTAGEIEARFGKRVAQLVAAESENKREDEPAKDTWKTRKQETIDHLAEAERDVKLICLGDKLSNLREISRDYKILGDELWKRFNQKDKNEHAWYYGAVGEKLSAAFGPIPAILEYAEIMKAVFGTEMKIR